jgi:excisionase family DNA binding protein
MNTFDKLVTTSELAEVLNVHIATIEKYVREGRIPHYRLDRGNRFNVAEVLEALKYKGNNDE